MDLATPQRSRRNADDIPCSAGTLSRKSLCAWRRILLRVRTTRLPIRLAYRPMGERPQQARHLALRMRHRMAVLERAKRTGAAATTASSAPLFPNRRSAWEGRGGGPPRAAPWRLERVSGYAMAGLAELLGHAEPAGHQSGRSHAEICRRGARSKRQALADGEGFRARRIAAQADLR